MRNDWVNGRGVLRNAPIISNYYKPLQDKKEKNMNAHYMKLLADKLSWYCQNIGEHIYTIIGELDVVAYVTPEPVPYERRMEGEKKVLRKGDIWGKLWDCAWMHVTGIVPHNFTGDIVTLLIDICGEALIVDKDGNPVRGLTCVDSQFDRDHGMPGKTEYTIKAKAGDKIDFWMDAANNDLIGQYRGGTIRTLDIAICNEEAVALHYDYIVLHDLMKKLSPDTPRYCSILYALNSVGELMYDFKAENIPQAREILKVELDKKGGTPSLTYYATGHAHMDLAWQWPIRETKRKAARTFATALANMEQYPEYIFGQSQPQQFQWMKEGYPELYARIKKAVKEGRLEPQGAMWVEPDTNVSGGEALVRQVMYGKKFWKDEFDVDMKVLHLPDVFGYTASLPQILKKSGVDYFLTIKMSWSMNNPFPYHTYNWVGMDGSEVLAHLPPEGNYVSCALPRALINGASAYMEKGLIDKAILLYGIGDGGGGPGKEHLEALRRGENLDGAYPVKRAQTIEFFRDIEKDRGKIKSYKGEMYLEKHRGTYTTQAKNKYYNRLLEKLLRDTEMVCAMDTWLTGLEYPQAKLEAIWKEVLLYQFHDILPGSSIQRVYDESVVRYQEMEKELREILTAHLNKGSSFFNTLSWDRTELIEKGGKYYKLTVPALSTNEATELDAIKELDISYNVDTLSNGLLTVQFNKDGGISSLIDVNGYEAIVGEANILNIYCDSEDAWDIDPEYMHKPVERIRLTDAETYLEGLYVIRKQTFAYNKSIFVQTIKLKAGSPYIEMETFVDWQESRKMFRIDGNFNVLTDKVVCDIQFGNIERSTLENNSYDFAQFEICVHKYLDLRTATNGVALLNDCKYGYRAKGNFMSLNALRSTDFPGKNADKGQHTFRYAIYPHSGENRVEQLSYEFNYDLYQTDRHIPQICEVDNKHIIVETIKMSEDGDGLIVRLYNDTSAPQTTKIQFANTVKKVKLVNLIEENISTLNIEDCAITQTFNPYEILTFKISK